MSRNLVINTTDRIQRKWTPSPEMAIREEDGDEEVSQPKIQRLIEEDEEEEEDDEEEEEEEEEDGSDFTSSPSIPDENINFDLVYTLHTFEATVDGQASVKKGDALTLLDDSNSYWWLIRDLKSSEVGYIPAENIETPFERLARLNKHRNVELTSIEQATHYINKPQPKVSHSRKVVLSTFLNVQLHVLLVGENEDEIEDEAYELWEEEMADDDDDNDDDNNNNEEEQEQVKQVQEEIVNTDDQQSQVNQVKNNPIVAKNNNECEVQQETITHNTVNNNADLSRVADVPDPNSKVLRVFAGNVDVGASYHSLRVNESTSVAELLFNAMEKFHISQIETKHGHHHGNSCVEYYLTVKTRDGDEITLDASDKPFAIYESLTTHLTTPMPSLTQFRQLTSTNSVSKQQKKKKRSSISGDTSLQFFMHKRIKRVNDKSGQIHIKVSLMTSVTPSLPEKMNAIKKMTSLRFNKKKSKKEIVELERIDKLIAIPASITIADLTSTALVKFHIISDKDQPHQYRLLLNANGKDKLLNATQQLSEVISDLGKSDKRFVLHNFNSSLDDHPQRSLSLSSSTSSSSSSSAAPNNRPTSSKVFPEIFPHRNPYSHSNHPVMTRLDSNTEAILKRVDAALESFEKSNNNPSRPKKNSFPSPMSVSRNESGVDIHLPHGLLRSTVLSDRKTQYSLMTAPNTLVLQKVLPADNKRSLLNTNSTSISGEELATLIKYGSQYLDTYDTANKPTLLSATSRLIVERDNEKSPSGLEDLEKEFQRIITSHSS